MLFFLQNVVAVSATLLTAPLAARSHVCVLLATRTLCRQCRMDSPLDLESPRNEWRFQERQQCSYAATPSPRRAFPDEYVHDRVTRDGPLRHN